MCIGLDDDLFKTLRPEIATRYGLSDQTCNVDFMRLGRGGKHLVVSGFEGFGLIRFGAADLLDELTTDDEYPASFCLRFAAMIEEWALCFSRDAVHKEFAYLAASGVATEINDRFSPRQEKLDHQRSLQVAREISRSFNSAGTRYNW